MFQLMIIDNNKEVVGAVTHPHFLPNVNDVYPNQNYIGVKVEYNEELIQNFNDYIFEDNKFKKKSIERETLLLTPEERLQALEEALLLLLMEG